MKRYLIPLFIAFSTMLCLHAAAQVTKPDWVRSPNGPNTVVDWNLKTKSLIVPHGPTLTLGGSQDSVGHVFMRLNPGVDTSFYMYVGGGVWKNVSKGGSSVNIYNHNGTLSSDRYLNGNNSKSLFLDSLRTFQANVTSTDFLGTGSMYLQLNGNTGNLAFHYGNGDQYNIGSDDGGGSGPTEFIIGGGNPFGNYASFDWSAVGSGGITVLDNTGYGLVAGYSVDTTKMGTGANTYVTSKWVLGRLHSLPGIGTTINALTNGAGIQTFSYNGGTSGITVKADTTFLKSKSGSLTDYNNLSTRINGKQAALSGTGFVKISGTTISYDNSTYLTGITSTQVTTALGFTPYNATNPNGYQTAVQVSDTIIAHKATIGYGLIYTLGTNTISADSTSLVSFGRLATNLNGYAKIGSSNTFTAANTFNASALGTTLATTNAIIVAGTITSATSGNQQQSGWIGFQGNGYNTTAAASQPIAMYFGLTPTQGTTVGGNLFLYASVNGATPTQTGIQFGATGAFLAGTISATAGSIGVTSTDGISEANATAATGSLAQWSRRFRQAGSYWNGSASTQAEVTQELQTTISSGATWVLSGRTGGTGSFNPYFGISVINGNWSLNGTAGTTGQVPSSTGSGMQWITPIGYSNFVTSEVPSGAINGSNTSFTIANSPVTGTIRLFWNGVRTTKFTNSGTGITTTFTPNTGDTILIDYQK